MPRKIWSIQYDENQITIEVLSNAITCYEDELARFNTFHCRQSNLDSAVATLRVLMDQHELNTADFENEIGEMRRVSQVLQGSGNYPK